MLDGELSHWEIPGISCSETPSNRERGRGYKAISLSKSVTAAREVPPPLAGSPSLRFTERHRSEPGKERACRRVLARAQPSDRFLDVDRTNVR
jgi:hypothetical protein